MKRESTPCLVEGIVKSRLPADKQPQTSFKFQWPGVPM